MEYNVNWVMAAESKPDPERKKEERQESKTSLEEGDKSKTRQEQDKTKIHVRQNNKK